MSEQTTKETINEIIETIEHAEPKQIELVEWVFSADVNNPYPASLLHMFYQITACNKLGIMQAKKKGTDEIHVILVGVDRNEDGELVTYPLAKILDESELGTYLAPKGDGTFVDDGEHIS